MAVHFSTGEDPPGTEPPAERDRFPLVLKTTAAVVAAALLGGFLLLSGGGGGEGDEAEDSPAVPTFPSPASPAEPTSTTTTPMLVAPQATGSATTAIVPTPPPASTPTPTAPPGPGSRFVVVGDPCPQPDAISFTRRYQPVVCTGTPPTWQPLF